MLGDPAQSGSPYTGPADGGCGTVRRYRSVSFLLAVPARTACAIATSLGLEPDAAVEADHLGVHVVVLDQGPHQMAELGCGSHPPGEDDRRGQPGLELVASRTRPVDRRIDDARTDGVHPDADGGQVPGGWHGHSDDPALGRRVGDLAGLSFDASR